MYNPTNEQAEADRQKAYETGVPHGYVAQGDKYNGLPTIALPVISDLHAPDEYGEKVDKRTGRHSGGPFVLHVSPKMRIEELRKVIMVRAYRLSLLYQACFHVATVSCRTKLVLFQHCRNSRTQGRIWRILSELWSSMGLPTGMPNSLDGL